MIISKTGRDITSNDAFDYIAGYGPFMCAQKIPCTNKPESALAVDMTARNVQEQAKKDRLPWTTAKGFDTFTPIGLVDNCIACIQLLTFWITRSFIPKSSIPDPSKLGLSLKVWTGVPIQRDLYQSIVQIGGQTKQNGKTSDMINDIPKLIQHVSSIMTLEVCRHLLMCGCV